MNLFQLWVQRIFRKGSLEEPLTKHTGSLKNHNICFRVGSSKEPLKMVLKKNLKGSPWASTPKTFSGSSTNHFSLQCRFCWHKALKIRSRASKKNSRLKEEEKKRARLLKQTDNFWNGSGESSEEESGEDEESNTFQPPATKKTKTVKRLKSINFVSPDDASALDRTVIGHMWNGDDTATKFVIRCAPLSFKLFTECAR